VAANALNYGSSFNQVHIHEGEYLHNLGFTGAGMTIAILDAGFFRYKTNPAFDSIRLQNRILGEWDFVANEQSVNEDHDHGAYCLSILAANRPGFIVGTAPHANYYLFRTEDAGSEYPVEEQNWAAAAERADSLGVDMISSSLGYADFDDARFDHAYTQRDGNTSIITRAADLAAKKGILVMNSAGNSGGSNNDLKYIACPADGDSVMAVGAVDINGTIAAFSSWGPNGAGKVKPNIVSVGAGTAYADINGNPQNGNGTSFSNPNVAGLIACLWEAYPEFTNVDIMQVVERSASRYANPDNRFGYGIPNFKKAVEILDQKRAGGDYATILKDDWIRTYPVPFKEALNVLFRAPGSGKASLRLLDILGRTLEIKTLEVLQNGFYTTSFTNTKGMSSGVYFLQYHDGKNKQLIRVIK
jgi:subtilisin family serine protease